MLTTRALQAPVKRPAAPFSSKSSTLGAIASPPVAPAATQVPKAAQQADPVRKLSFYFGLAFVFVVFGVLPELTYYVTGLNTYLIYWVAPAAILGALFTGGLRRTLQYRAAWYWIAFFVWMVVGIPFSYWRGGSIANYLRLHPGVHDNAVRGRGFGHQLGRSPGSFLYHWNGWASSIS